MEIIVQPTINDATQLVADIITAAIEEKPDLVLGLATGTTMEPLYAELVKRYRESEQDQKEKKLDFRRVTTFNLDEFVDLERDHPSTYYSFMRRHLFEHINIAAAQTHFPLEKGKSISQSCVDYEREIQRAGGIDIQLLGIGADGHIAFNEPSSSLASRTRIKTLTRDSVVEARRWWRPEEQIVPHVVTMGIATILEARTCILMAFGAKKATAIARAVEGPVTAMVPASALQLHEKTLVITDELAAGNLQLLDYYKYVYNNKPTWQKQNYTPSCDD